MPGDLDLISELFGEAACFVKTLPPLPLDASKSRAVVAGPILRSLRVCIEWQRNLRAPSVPRARERISRFGAVAITVAFLTVPAPAQQSGQGGQGQGQGQGQGGQAGQGQKQGQTDGQGGQAGQGKQNRNQDQNQNRGQKDAKAGQNGYAFGSINQRPWFADNQVRTHLKLNEDQFNRLNAAYGKSWDRYNSEIGRLGDDERARERRTELSGAFNTGFGTSANEILNAEQRSRFNQLSFQYQGVNAFNDPAFATELRLSADQRRELRTLGTTFDTQIGRLHGRFTTDRDGAGRDFADARRNLNERIQKLLNDDQRRLWMERNGESWQWSYPVEVRAERRDR